VLFVEQWVQTFNEMRAHIEALEAELVAAKAARP
jgi:hypothetical protein